MKNISLAGLVIVLAIHAGCKNGSDGTGNGVPAVTSPANPQDITAPNTATQQVTPPNTTPVSPSFVPVNNPSPTITANPSAANTTAAGLNPAHGQPGHRCDIPVGTPLNSKPATPANGTSPAITTQPIVTQTQPVISSAPSNTPTAPGMNPAHGQPGHRCDIPVGSPLNSPPAVAKPTGANTPISITPEVKKQ